MEILKLDLENTGPDAPTESEVRFQIALLTAIGTTAVSLFVRFAFDAPLLPELLAHAIFAILPISLIAFVVAFLGLFAKHLAFLVCVLIYLTGLSAAAFFFLRFYDPQTSLQARILRLAGLLIAIWLVTMVIVIPLLGGGFFGQYLRQGMAVSSLWFLAIFLVFVLSLKLISGFYLVKPEVVRTNNYRFSRRRVMRGVGFTVLGVGIYDIGQSLIKTWFQFTSGRVSGGDGIFPNINGLAREVTPTAEFYQVSKNPFDPDIGIAKWRLEIGGLVDAPLTLGFDDLRAFEPIEQYMTLACIDNPVGGNLIANALWRGVRLKEVLDRAGLRDGVVDIVFFAADGYTDSISLERATNEGTLLAYHMNGEPLTPTHGFPLRLLVPGIFGMKNVKWITRIEAVDYNFKGYWQKRGWDDKAEYKTLSRIDVPESSIKESNGRATIAGIAFAGDRGISRVEVSTDGGRNWEQADTKSALSPNSWVLWKREWVPAKSGAFQVKVRATDGRGEVQTAQNTSPDPSGATGQHSVTIKVD